MSPSLHILVCDMTGDVLCLVGMHTMASSSFSSTPCSTSSSVHHHYPGDCHPIIDLRSLSPRRSPFCPSSGLKPISHRHHVAQVRRRFLVWHQQDRQRNYPRPFICQ
ncbi:hypothetical protein BC829DRAFT_201801 [Chytridium lagenaria]|nr:hypothetical protein BC829DRAFT_201801 [Chytridium lagenaria]